MKLFAALSLVLITLPGPSQSASVPQAEQLDVATLKPQYPHRLFAFSEADGVKIVNGDSLEIEGLIPAASSSMLALDPAGRYFYVCESIWTHGNRGKRDDMISVYDSRTLTLLTEIGLPVARALADPLVHGCDISADGRFAYVYNMQPASAVTIVDLQQRKAVSTVELPGCALAFPWGDRGFSALCGDGSVATVPLSASGHAGRITHTAKFFEADRDPIFSESLIDRSTGRAYFLSYTGLIYPAQLGERSSVERPWSLQAAAGFDVATTSMHALAWRPGGTGCVIAWHKPSGRLYVLMHPGTHWTERVAGTEVWVVDTASRKVLNRIQLTEPAETVAISQDEQPVLYTLTSSGAIVTYDPDSGQQRGKAKTRGGEIAWVPGF
jgi:methylamine dehydrogenase heavy chain